jgi:hypothetical protein
MSMASSTEGTILMNINLDGKTLYLSDKYITVTYEHEGLVTDWGSADSASGSAGISEISDCTITLFNKKLMYMDSDTRFSEIFDNYTFEGRKVELRQYFPGTSYANCDVFLTGKIDSISFDDMYITISIKDDEDVFKEVPLGRISKYEFSGCPDDAVGLGKPIIYGVPSSAETSLTPKELFPTVCVNKYSNQYLIADHVVAQAAFPSLLEPGHLYLYIEEANTYLWCNNSSSSSYSNTSAGAFITINDSSGWTFYGRPNIKGYNYNMTATDYSHAVDEDKTSTLVLEDGKKFYLTMGDLPDMGPIKPSVAYLYVALSSATGSSPYGTLTYYNPDYNNGNGGTATGISIDAAAVAAGFAQFQFNVDFSAHGEADDQSDQYNIWNWNEIGKYEFGIEVGAGDTITISDFYIFITDLNFAPQRRVRGQKKISSRTSGSRR